MLSRGISRVLLVSLLMGGWAAPASAQTSEPKTVRVQLKISADAQLKALVQTAMEGELRALPGVLITDSGANYTISVIALGVANQSRRTVGVTFSVLVTAPLADHVRQFSERHLARDSSDQLAAMLAGAVRPVSHWVETSSGSDVPEVCKSIVQSFAKDTLRH